MPKTLVFLDIQHMGKISKLWDRGASADVDKDGIEEQEAFLTWQIALIAHRELIAKGHPVICLSDGGYADRQSRCNQYQERIAPQNAVYIAMHLNAGGGSYAASFFDHRSQRGAALGECINIEQALLCSEISSFKVIPATPSNWTKHAYNTIKGARAIGICWEPAFLDNRDHHPLFHPEGIMRIGQSLANGIDSFFRSLP